MIDADTLSVKLESTCQVSHCQRPIHAHSYCQRHYQQIRRHGQLTPECEQKSARGPQALCKASGCGDAAATLGYCPRHYQQVRRHGRLTPERERIYGRQGCLVADCAESHSAQGYCKNHYMLIYYPSSSAAARTPVRATA